MIRTLTAAACLGAAAAGAAPLPADPLERECWQRHTRERTRVDLSEPTAVGFSNLRHGDVVASPFRVEFAVRGMGVVPAGLAQAGTGHHHILVNARLPINVTEKIPFSDTHRHFGKGQTATTLDLPPGRHTLRLLFADHEHRPHFVFSPEITVEVRGPRSAVPRPRIDPRDPDASCAAWYQDQRSRPRPPDEPLYVENIRAEETLTSPFNIRLGVDGFGVCARGQQAEKTGHFMLEVLTRAERRPVQTWNLANGATQVNAFVPPGAYLLKLRFVDNAQGSDLLPPHELPVTVATQERW